MKQLVTLQLTIQLECSDQYAEELKKDPIKKSVKACFRNNNRTIVNAEVIDTEFIDAGVDGTLLMKGAKIKVEPTEDQPKLGQGYIGLL